MQKIYSRYALLLIGGLFLMISIASCKKDHFAPVTPKQAALATIGLYEKLVDTDRRIYVAISQVGTNKVNYISVFDTGSTGMTIDATDLIPASMITSSGIQVPGDSVVVNGITITNQAAVVSYGDVGSETQEFGNLAYATVTIGDQNGSIVAKRIPFFLYYKILNVSANQVLPAHSNDVFGVGPGVSLASSSIGSPLSYFTGTNITSGFKLAKLNAAQFTAAGPYVAGLLTIGLVPADLTSNGFIMHPLNTASEGGYSPDIPATINYNGTNVAASVLFDTGTPSVSVVEDAGATAESSLPANSTVTLTTANGFSYSYTTSSSFNLTHISQPSVTGDPRTIFSIDFFENNEYLLNYTGHEIGLKNN